MRAENCQTPDLGLGQGVDFTFVWDNNNNVINDDNKTTITTTTTTTKQ